MSAIYTNCVSAELRLLRERCAIEVAHDTALWADAFPGSLRDDLIREVYAMRAQAQRQLVRSVLYGDETA